jgi:LysM repeat protein
VKDGDTYHSISQQFGMKVVKLLQLNGKSFVSLIVPGEKLILK